MVSVLPFTVTIGGISRSGDRTIFFCRLLISINLLNLSTILLTLWLSNESLGVMDNKRGGVVSFSPPLGGTILAHENCIRAHMDRLTHFTHCFITINIFYSGPKIRLYCYIIYP